MNWLPRLSCLPKQADRLPNDIAVSIHAALNARKVLASGRDARYVVFEAHNAGRLHSLLGFNALPGPHAPVLS